MTLRIFCYMSILALLSVACGGVKAPISEGQKPKSIRISNAKNLTKAYHKHKVNFQTLSAQLHISYDLKETQGSNSLSIRMQKDSLIWLSAAFGILKAQLTPKEVSFYNKLSNTYYQGDYTALSQWIGVEIDFYFLQNILIGNSAIPFEKKYLQSFQIKDKKSILVELSDLPLKAKVILSAENATLKQQQYRHTRHKSTLSASYTYQWLSRFAYPLRVDMNMKKDAMRGSVHISYKNLRIDSPIRFPYQIPKGYQKISL